jgi:hypothetical protein
MSTSNGENHNHHFYLSSAAQWCTTGDSRGHKRTLTEAIKLMEADKMTYVIWYVPAAPDAEYAVQFYAPQVEGAHIVELVEYKNGRKVKGEKK